MKAQTRGERHALTSDIAADRKHRRQRITAICDRIHARRKKVAEEVRPIVDINQNVGQVGLEKPRLDEVFENLDRGRLIQRLQGG